MSNSKYPLCEKAGLGITQIPSNSVAAVNKPFVWAEEVERLLASAPVVTGHNNSPNSSWWAATDVELCKHSHQARLLLIEPIKQDTAESLLRELIRCWEMSTNGNIVDTYKVIDRARKLVGP